MAISKKTKVRVEVFDCKRTTNETIHRLAALAQDPDLWFARSDIVCAMEALEKAKDILTRANHIIDMDFEEE